MSFRFKKVTSPQPVVAYMADVLTHALRGGKKVLWFLSGGSAIDIAVAVAKQLPEDATGLTITLIDERYGPVGHADSNWQQLIAAGFVAPGAVLQPVLEGKSMEQTAEDFAAMLAQEMQQADYRVGLLGIGPDGHTSGILPQAPAVTADGLVCAYEGGGYRRITTTPRAVAALDEVVVYAMGEAKWPVLDALAGELPLAEQPAQILKQVPTVTIFNDHRGEQP